MELGRVSVCCGIPSHSQGLPQADYRRATKKKGTARNAGDGWVTLTRQMKEDDGMKSAPVVIHSSLSGSANEAHAHKVGAGGHAAKVVPGELVNEVVKVLAAPSK